jgi:hypothetical protein
MITRPTVTGNERGKGTNIPTRIDTASINAIITNVSFNQSSLANKILDNY